MRRSAVVVLLALLTPVTWAAEGVRDLFPGPQEVSGWSISADIREYDADTIPEWLGDGAGIFADYNAEAGAHAEYTGPEDAAVTVEIYRMKGPADAFGIWGCHRPQKAERLDISRDAYLAAPTGGLWRGDYFIKVTGRPEKAAAAAVRAFLSVISSKISEGGTLPDMFRVLEIEGYLKGSQRYLHTKRALDKLHFIAGENVLNLGEKTEMVLGKYLIDNRLFEAFVTVYSSEAAAVSAASSLAAYLGKNPEAEATWYKQRGKTIVGAWTGLKVPETLDSEYMIYDTIKELLRQVRIFQLDK